MVRLITSKSPSVLLFIAAAFWGLYWLPLREIEGAGLSNAWSVAFFNVCPLILLIPYVIWHRKVQFQHLGAVFLIAALTGVGLSFYATGLVVSSVVRATLLFYLTPIWSTIIGVIWLSERLTSKRVTAILLGLFGLVLLLSGSGDETLPLNIGDVFALLSGVLWGMGAAGMKRWPDAPTVATTTGQFAVTVTVSVLLGIFVFHESAPTLAAITAALPVAFTASTFVLLPSIFIIFWASKRLFPGRVGVLMMSEALVAIISASFLLPEETMTVMQWIGGTIIITACFVEVFEKEE